MTQSPPPFSLADLRREIDRIDETMHRLLMERGEIIETLIEVKKTQASGSESIWRVIISTFTYVQAP